MRSELLRALVDQDFAGEAALFSGLWTLRTLATLPPPKQTGLKAEVKLRHSFRCK